MSLLNNALLQKFNFLLSFRQNDTALNHSETGYTAAPCNNAVSAVNNATPADTNQKNLLVNVPNKTEIIDKIEKNNLQGTLPRNGTLCRKVYL